jgi:hypothetical protein
MVSFRCFFSWRLWIVSSETFGVMRNGASGSPETATNVNTRKLAAKRTTML